LSTEGAVARIALNPAASAVSSHVYWTAPVQRFLMVNVGIIGVSGVDAPTLTGSVNNAIAAKELFLRHRLLTDFTDVANIGS
jgi:hypothetical protein